MLIVQPALLLVFVVHIAAGALALGAGLVALFAAKGGSLHRRAGTVFFTAMLVMAIFAAILAVAMPGQIINLFISAFTLYLVATGWLTIRRRAGAIGLAERLAMVVALILCAPFAAVVFQMATGLVLFKTAFALEGPILVALYAFTTILFIAAIADVKIVLAGGITGAPRIARHLWRMCLGLTLAAGSAFTNGFARLLPGHYHVPRVFFLPQLLLLGVLVFWVIRVRFTGWLPRRQGGDLAIPIAQEG